MSNYGGSFTYGVDMVLCIDGTGSMDPVIDNVKANATRLYSDLQRAMDEKDKHIDSLRVRVIVFRDYYFDSVAESMESSPFFDLATEQDAFADHVSRITAFGGGDEPECGLEALVTAMRSDWQSDVAKRRQVIVVWTDASTHDLFKDSVAGYPADMVRNFDDLSDYWDGQSSPMGSSAKRLILFAPDATRWNDISAFWDQVVHFPSQAGNGLAETDYSAILEAIANSI